MGGHGRKNSELTWCTLYFVQGVCIGVLLAIPGRIELRMERRTGALSAIKRALLLSVWWRRSWAKRQNSSVQLVYEIWILPYRLSYWVSLSENISFRISWAYLMGLEANPELLGFSEYHWNLGKVWDFCRVKAMRKYELLNVWLFLNPFRNPLS